MEPTIEPTSHSASRSTANAQATFCATLVDEWVRCGVKHAFVAPGSRSTPLAIALESNPGVRVEMFIDERSAAFAALGSGQVTGLPAIALCTSGTAATHFHAAVVEAHLSAVPLIVCTADRPPEARDVGAPQTIDQTALFGNAVRWFHDPGVASYDAADTWRSLANHVVARTTGPVPGPVHVNLPFREPLLGEVVDLPPSRSHDGPWSGHLHAKSLLSDWEIEDLAHRLVGRRGVIVAGHPGGGYVLGAYAAAATVLASVLDWPVLACPRSGVRVEGGNIVAHFDGIVRSQAARNDLKPEVVLRLGAPPASKVLGQWIASIGAEQIVVHSPGTYLDPDHMVANHIEADVTNTVDRLCAVAADLQSKNSPPGGEPFVWSRKWQRADELAERAIETRLNATSGLTDPHVARAIAASSQIAVVSSSMPIRDIEWFASTGDGLLVYANRGANGIDGVIATAIGVASELGKATVYLGDVAFLHDLSSLAMLSARNLDLCIVVTDNDGGGIFSFLPQASAVPHGAFEKLFATPHASNLASIAAGFGLNVAVPTNTAELSEALAGSGTKVVVVRTNRQTNVDLHGSLNTDIVSAIDESFRGG